MMRRAGRGNCFLLLLLLVLSLPVISNTQESAPCTAHFKLGIGEPWPPFFMHDNDQYFGIDIDITRLIFKKLNYCLEIVKLPSSARGILQLKRGEIDFLNAASFNEERAKIGWFSSPYRSEAMRIFHHQKNRDKFQISSLYELQKQDLVGVVNLGAYYGAEFSYLMQETSFNSKIASVPSVEQRMKMLELGHVDFVIDDIVPGRYYLRHHQNAMLEMASYAVHDNPIYFLFSRKTVSPEQVSLFNQVILRHYPEIEAVVDHYLY